MKKFSIFLAILLAFGLAFTSCDNGNTGNTGPKTIVITGLPAGVFERAYINLSNDGSGGANGEESIYSDDSIAIPLLDPWGGPSTPFTGSGSYRVELILITSANTYYHYVYTNGKTLAQLGINSDDIDFDKLPKYKIISEVSIIPFSKFREHYRI
jgi:hypothetical protein